jgi:hypothetical protein
METNARQIDGNERTRKRPFSFPLLNHCETYKSLPFAAFCDRWNLMARKLNLEIE